MKVRQIRFFAFLFVPILLLSSLQCLAQTGLVISQIYGGGGNSGAIYTYDFLELYNPTGSDISLNGLSFQYASATGTSWTSVALPNATISAGHYFLIQGVAGSTAVANLPVTPDFTVDKNTAGGSAPNFSATTGKIALVNGTTPLSGACPSGANILDLVGYGTANCFLGAVATAPANATALIRSDLTTNAKNNLSDFSVVSPVPHNSTSIATRAIATPSTVDSGSTVLLTVKLLAGGTATVTADLTSIGGGSQILYDDGTHGDVTAGDSVYSYSTTATVTVTGLASIPVTVTNSQTSTATGISLTVNLPVPSLSINQIQGRKSLTATTVSPYVGQTVSTSGIVTGIGSAGFFIQTPDSAVDSDPLTPEGLYVFTGSGKVPATAVIGNLVQVTGKISTYPTASHTPATELNTTAADILQPSQPLPSPVAITSAMLSPAGGLYQLTPYEGMRVSIPSLTTVSGTDGSLTSEANETQASNGQFYAVLSGTARPFREPGVDIRDAQTGLPSDVAKFDDNPERILVDSTFLGGSAIDLATGATLTNVTGILDFTYSADSYYDPSRLLLDKSYSASNVTTGMTVQAAALPGSNEFTVAAFNIERFFNPSSTDDISYSPVSQKTSKSSAVDVTATAYANRQAKVSLAIRNVLNNPDIVALEEIENQTVAADIAAKISADATAASQTDPKYVAFGTGTDYAPYTNDPGGISTGFLVRSDRINALKVEQFGANETFPDPRNSSTSQILNDRPPLVLHAGVKRAKATDYPVTVIVNHLRSLSGENDATNGIYVQTKKELQAEYLAKLIQGYQSAGEHVVSVGDYNAFQFSDGYIDILATITNRNVLPSTQVVVPGVADLVSPSTTNLASLLPEEQRWSYQEYGNAQILDHIVVTQDLVNAGAHMQYVHLNADQPVISYNNPAIPDRVSDHDPALGYFAIPSPVFSASLTGTGVFGITPVGASSSGQNFVLTNTGEGTLTIQSITISGDFAASNNCASTLAINDTCAINVVFHPTVKGVRSGRITVTTDSTSSTLDVTGTGLGPDYSATLTGNATFGAIKIGSSSAPQIFTFTNTGEKALSITAINATGDFAQTNNCGLSLATQASCTISVVFTATAEGNRSGVLSVNTNETSAAALYSAILSGTGVALNRSAALTGKADFGSVTLGAASSMQSFAFTNTGETVLTIASVAATGDFSQTNDCGAIVAVNKSCTINVIFKPAGTGPRNGSLTVTTDSTSSTASLSGTGVSADFGIGGGSSSGDSAPTTAVTAGGSSTVPLTITPGSAFNGTISFTCAIASGTAPAGVTCTPPDPITVKSGSTAVTVNVTFTTTPQLAIAGAEQFVAGNKLYNGILLAALLLMLSFAWKARKMARVAGMLTVLFGVFLMTIGCGSNQKKLVTNTNGTPSGTYTYALTATAGTVSHTQTVTLVVK